jgi:uncharacterized SAM-binding protein YcdF (DUF218 family)
VAVVLLAFLFRSLWLPVLGLALVHDDGPAKADFAVSLGGDYYGQRVEEAAGLVRAGYVPQVLVSGPAIIYGAVERDLAIAFVVHQGFPQEWFWGIPGHALSTREEAHEVLSELRRRNAQSFLLVTSDYHSARAGRTFRAVAREMGYTPRMRTVVAPDHYFQVANWWHSREGRKTIFLEWSKTVGAAIGL